MTWSAKSNDSERTNFYYFINKIIIYKIIKILFIKFYYFIIIIKKGQMRW